MLVERACHALEVDLAEVMQYVKEQAPRGEALTEVVKRSGAELPVPGIVQLHWEVLQLGRGALPETVRR